MTWKPNATVAVVVPRADTFLIVEEESDGAIVFNQPAGHIEKGESILDAARREALEETGYRLALTGLLGIYIYHSPHNDTTYHRYTFVAEALEKVTDSLDEGIIGALWLTEEQLRQSDKLRSPVVVRCIEDYRNHKLLPLETIREVNN